MRPQLPITYVNRAFPRNRPAVSAFAPIQQGLTRPFPEANESTNILDAMNTVYQKYHNVNPNVEKIIEQTNKELVHIRPAGGNICPFTKEEIGHINMNTLNNLMQSQPQDVNLIKILNCLVNYIVISPNYQQLPSKNLRLRHWLTNLKTLSEGSFGKTYTADLANKKLLLNQFVIKAIDDNVDINGRLTPANPTRNADFIHEYFVAQILLNKLRDYIPNFAYIYGAFACSPPLNPNGNEVITYCNKNNDFDIRYLIYEKIEGPTASAFIEYCSVSDYLNIILQLTLALYTANNYDIEDTRYTYTHYDLHCGNVIIKNPRNNTDNFYIPYKLEGAPVYLLTHNIAVIIDFGFSFVSTGTGETEEKFGHYGAGDMGVLTTKAFPVYDIFKFLVDSYYRTKSNEVRDVIQGLFKFFTNTPITVVLRDWDHGRPFLPDVANYANLTLLQFYNHIKFNYAIYFDRIITNTFNFNNEKMYDCVVSGLCHSEAVIKDMIIDNKNYNDLDIFNFYDIMTETEIQEIITNNGPEQQPIYHINREQRQQAFDQYMGRLPKAIEELSEFINYNVNVYKTNMPLFDNIKTLSNNVNQIIGDVKGYLTYVSSVAKILEATDNLDLANHLTVFMLENYGREFVYKNYRVDLQQFIQRINFPTRYESIDDRLIFINKDIELLSEIPSQKIVRVDRILDELYDSIKWFRYLILNKIK